MYFYGFLKYYKYVIRSVIARSYYILYYCSLFCGSNSLNHTAAIVMYNIVRTLPLGPYRRWFIRFLLMATTSSRASDNFVKSNHIHNIIIWELFFFSLSTQRTFGRSPATEYINCRLMGTLRKPPRSDQYKPPTGSTHVTTVIVVYWKPSW